jgi:accessory gene regulator protein AgrB
MNAGVPQQARYDLGSYTRANGTTPTRTTVVNVERVRFNGFVWFLIFLVLIGLLLFLFKPSIVTSTNPVTGESQLDWGKLIIWSVLFALIILLILWLTRGIHGLIVD